MSRHAEERAATTPLESDARGRGVSYRWLDVLSVVGVMLPFLAVAVRINLGGAVVLAGESALTELHVGDAARLAQWVGPVENQVASQPGPVWYQLLAVLQAPFGGSAASLVAGSLVLEAFVAASVVVAVGPFHRRARPVAAVIVLVLVLRLPEYFFSLSGQTALLLPVVLLLVLAARAVTGDLAAAAGVLLVGSTSVLTEVRTGALVVPMVLAALVGAARSRGAWGGLSVRARVLVVGGAGLAALVWAPTVWQQLRPGSRGGNAGRLLHALVDGTTGRGSSWSASVEAVGRSVAVPVIGAPTSSSPTTGIGVIAALVLAGGALGVVGRQRHRWLPGILGAGVVVGAGAFVLVARAQDHVPVAEDVLPAAALPAVLAIGAACAVLPRTVVGRPLVPVALCAVLAGLAVLSGVVLGARASTGLAATGVSELTDIVDAGVPADQASLPVLVEIVDPALWPVAAGLVAGLEERGRAATVSEPWVEAFGPGRASNGDEMWRISVVPAAEAPEVPYGAVIGTVTTDQGPVAVILSQPVPAG